MSPKPTNATSFLLLALLILAHIHQTQAYITVTQLRTLLTLLHQTSNIVSLLQLHTHLSLSHTVVSRVANLRLSRDDIEGARRAQFIANKLELLLGFSFWPTVLPVVWDYFWNYAWTNPPSVRDAVDIVADVNELLASLSKPTRLQIASEQDVRRASKSLFNRLLSIFNKSEFVRDLVEVLEKEMEEGDFLKDCLEVGSNDLKGVLQIIKALASHYAPSDHKQEP